MGCVVVMIAFLLFGGCIGLGWESFSLLGFVPHITENQFDGIMGLSLCIGFPAGLALEIIGA